MNVLMFAPTCPIWAKAPAPTARWITNPVSFAELSVHASFILLPARGVAVSPLGAAIGPATAFEIDCAVIVGNAPPYPTVFCAMTRY